jgi:hypothetical protein
MDQPTGRKASTRHRVPRPGPSAAPDVLGRIRERVDGAAAAGLIDTVTAMRLRAELGRVAALRRMLAQRPRAPLTGRA